MRLFTLTLITLFFSLSAVEETAWRDYTRPVTINEKKDIAFIINTMGMSNLLSVASEQAKLHKAGNRVEHVHPLRFLMTIFTDEQMKCSMHALKDRMWLWDEFYTGLAKNLETETNRGNMKPQYIQDFAKKVGIDANLIYPYINERQWLQFLCVLIDKIPRKQNPNRYNM